MRAAIAILAIATATGVIAYAQISGQNAASGQAVEETATDLEVDQETLSIGAALYAENCASCHGANLEGQPDWKRRLPSGKMPAPPHDATGHTWHHADEQLFLMTKEGIGAVVGGDYESDMPAFGGILTDEEIRAILAYIKSTWPEREKAFQAEVTRNMQESSQ